MSEAQLWILSSISFRHIKRSLEEQWHRRGHVSAGWTDRLERMWLVLQSLGYEEHFGQLSSSSGECHSDSVLDDNIFALLLFCVLSLSVWTIFCSSRTSCCVLIRSELNGVNSSFLLSQTKHPPGFKQRLFAVTQSSFNASLCYWWSSGRAAIPASLSLIWIKSCLYWQQM